MPSRVSGAPFWVPIRLEARFRYPAAASSDAGAGVAGWPSHRAGSCMVRPEIAAARNRQVSRVCAAGPHSSRRPGSSTVKTKWLASRGAVSTLVTSGRKSIQKTWGWQQMPHGSNRFTGPFSARIAAVAAHRSGLLDVARTAPGAERVSGMERLVVFPAPGPMKSISVSRQPEYSAGPGARPGRSRSPSSIPASPSLIFAGLRSLRDGRSWVARPAVRGRVRLARRRWLLARAATGTSGGGMNRGPMRAHPALPARAAAAASREVQVMTSRVLVPGHAAARCPPARSAAKVSPYAVTCPPPIAAAILAPVQAAKAAPAGIQQQASTIQPGIAVDPVTGWRGPSARLTVCPPARPGGWPGQLQEVSGVRDIGIRATSPPPPSARLRDALLCPVGAAAAGEDQPPELHLTGKAGAGQPASSGRIGKILEFAAVLREHPFWVQAAPGARHGERNSLARPAAGDIRQVVRRRGRSSLRQPGVRAVRDEPARRTQGQCPPGP